MLLEVQRDDLERGSRMIKSSKLRLKNGQTKHRNTREQVQMELSSSAKFKDTKSYQTLHDNLQKTRYGIKRVLKKQKDGRPLVEYM